MVGIIKSLIRNIGDNWKEIRNIERKYNKKKEEYWK